MSSGRSRSGGSANLEDVQAVVEVLAERAAFNGRAAGCGWSRRRLATSALSVRVPPSRWNSRSCSTRRNLACTDGLISPTSSRKSTPPAACSSWPGLRLHRARERAALESEQLRLEERLRERSAVQGDEGTSAPRRGTVDEPRDDFFARARLAEQQHRRVGGGHLRRLLEDLRPRRRLADHPPIPGHGVQFVGERLHARFEPRGALGRFGRRASPPRGRARASG